MKPIRSALLLLAPAAVFAQAPAEPKPLVHGPDGRIQWTAVIDGKEVPAPEIEMGDDATVLAILDEGRNRNQVMDHLRHLTQAIGPRLTGSTNAEMANHWCRDQYAAWGLDNPRLEEWGTIATRFDRGPCAGKLLLRRERDRDGETIVNYETLRELQFSAAAWSAGTSGPLRAPIVKEPRTEEEYELVKDRLQGAWILQRPPAPSARQGVRRGPRGWFEAAASARRKVDAGETTVEELPIPQRLVFAGAAGFVTTGRDERVWTSSIPGWREREADAIPPDLHVTIRGSDYDAINSRLADGEPVELEFTLNHEITPGPVPCYNTIAEIRGADLPDEVVIISAHLDSWNGPGSEGCLDNGVGSSVTLEAARILAAVKARPRRTIRFINWTGEEQGLLGSRAYVKTHQDHLDKVSACFVDDGGTNYQGGLRVADNMLDMIAAATAPTNNQFYSQTDGKWLNVNIRGSGRRIATHGSSDHASFNAVGVPGFFWDEVGRSDYQYGWHTQNDTYDLAIAEYLVQSSTNSAIVAYRLACAPTLLPREVREAPAQRDDNPPAEPGRPPAPDEPARN